MALPRIAAPGEQALPNLNTETAPRSDASDFGSAIGAGMQQAGRAIGQVAGDVADYHERKEKLWLANATSQANWHWQQRFAELESLPADQIPENFSATFKTEWEDYTAEQMKGAPTGYAGQAYKQSLDAMGASFYGKASRFDAARSAAQTGNNYSGAVNNSVSAALANGDVEGAQKILDGLTDTATGAVATETVQQVYGQAKGQIQNAEIQKSIQFEGAAETASALRDGKLLADKSPEDREAAANEIERQGNLNVVASSTAANKMLQEAENAVIYGLPDAEAKVAGAKQAFLASKTAGKGLKAMASAGPKAEEEFNLRISQAKLAANITKSYIGRSAQDLDQAIKRMEPMVGGASPVIRQLKNMQDTLEKDPALYAMMDSSIRTEAQGVAGMWKGAQTQEQVQAAGAAQLQLNSKIISVQKSAGIPERNISILSNEEVGTYRKQMLENPAKARDTYNGLAARNGQEFAPIVLRQLFQKKEGEGYALPAVYELAAMNPGDLKIWDSAQTKTATKAEDLNKLSDDIRTNKEFQKYSAAMAANGGAGVEDVVRKSQGLATLADFYMSLPEKGGGGLSKNEAISRAIDTTLKNAFTFSDGQNGWKLAMPKGDIPDEPTAKGTVQNLQQIVLGEIANPNSAIVIPPGGSGVQEVDQKFFADRVLNDGFWATDGDGAVRMVPNVRGEPVPVMLHQPDGTEAPWRVSWKDARDKTFIGESDKPKSGSYMSTGLRAAFGGEWSGFAITFMDSAKKTHPKEASTETKQPAIETNAPDLKQPIEEKNMNDMANKIVDFEGRFKNGKLQVYKLPSNDGGGTFEVAGINDRYHPEMARKLKGLIEAGKNDEAKAEAAAYIQKYTDGVAKWTSNKGVESYLRDTAFNRGPGGAAKVLQMALGVSVDGKVGPKTLSALKEAEKNPQELLGKLRVAREKYELKVAGRRENLWSGLVDRWDGSLAYAKTLA